MRKIHFHIGPHKTGSTAIQRAFKDHADQILAQTGCYYVTSPLVQSIGKHLWRGQFDQAKPLLNELAQELSATPHKEFLISCEDFAGDLPGRSGKRRVYPHLWQNINHLSKAFDAFEAHYYFFVRPPMDWLKSAYAQNLKYRNKFKSFDEFTRFLKTEELWDGVLERPRNRLKKRLIEIRYRNGSKHSAISDLAARIPSLATLDLSGIESKGVNASPSAEIIAAYEVINAAGSSFHAKKTAKKCVAVDMRQGEDTLQDAPGWPPEVHMPDDLPPGLEALWVRTDTRVSASLQPNLMPPLDSDLRSLRTVLVKGSAQFPEGGREKMENQTKILEYRFQGLPQICYLLGLTISYLRRDTDHTDHARQLFHRLWAEEYPMLLAVLPTRWLISTFQTFMDHGLNENQRSIGTAAFFFCNLMKAYEAERAFETQPADAIYPNVTPQTPSGFAGMDRFKLGGTDLMLNTNAMLLELAARDEVAGRVLMEFLLRMKASGNVFTRMDNSRKSHDISLPKFGNCWSFFEEP